MRQQVLVGLAVGLLLALSPAAWAARQAEAADPAAIRFELPSQPQPLCLAAEEYQGLLMLPLKTAVGYLGGKTRWQDHARKVVVTGNSGRQAVLALDLNRAVLGTRAWVRLPHLPRMLRGQVMVSPETLEVIWNAVGTPAPDYDSSRKIFRVAEPGKAAAPAGTAARPPVPGRLPAHPLVVVDAGHGGKDPGAIGPTGVKEKNVVLEIALQLRACLEEKGVKVVMTRDDDTFIPLPGRADIANRSKADLFVSVHANASRNRQASGSQVYIYNREASSRHAAEAARLENQDANYVEIIKDDLRQSGHEESSITVGGLVSQEIEKLNMDVKRIERAPFYVLAKSHMPSILVETAYISNYTEEQKLQNLAFCQKLAAGIEQGVRLYLAEKNAGTDDRGRVIPQLTIQTRKPYNRPAMHAR